MTIASAALLLFLILDPPGNIPVFLSILRHLPPKRQRIVLARELLIALGVLMVFLWVGKHALEVMHLRQESVSIAGGIVLFLIGIRMIFPPPEGLMGEIPGGEPFIVPLAVPLVAGPSGMAADAEGRSRTLSGVEPGAEIAWAHRCAPVLRPACTAGAQCPDRWAPDGMCCGDSVICCLTPVLLPGGPGSVETVIPCNKAGYVLIGRNRCPCGRGVSGIPPKTSIVRWRDPFPAKSSHEPSHASGGRNFR